MSDARILKWDPATRTKSLFHYCDHDDSFAIESKQDAEPIIDCNKVLQNLRVGTATKYDPKKAMHLVASIPLNLWYKLKREGILEDPKKFARWLNEPDNRHFRTNRARI